MGIANWRTMLLEYHQLLIILLPEECDVGLDDIEQFHHDRGNASKMPSAKLPFECGDVFGCRVHMIGLRNWVHIRFARCEHMSDARALELLAIRFECPRIVIEVFVGTELQPIHEHAGDDRVGMFGRLLHEGDVAFMQVAHRGHEGDTAEAWAHGAKCGNGSMNLHGWNQ